MFSDELEMLIEAAIADGEISEKERAILHKRAQAEGVDTDELDMIVDARIAKLKKAQRESEEEEEYDDETIKSAFQLFTKKFDELNNKEYEYQKGNFWKGISGKSAEEQKQEAILNFIPSFFIPTTKKDLIDFILYLKPYKNVNDWTGSAGFERDKGKAFRKRYEECITKAKTSFPDDPDIEFAINGPKKEKKGFFGFGKKS